MSQRPTLGSTVLFHLGREPVSKEAVLRPARVVRVWPGASGHGVNLQVDLDGSNDARVAVFCGSGTVPEEQPAVFPGECEIGRAWRTSVAEGTGEGTWRWPTQA